MTEKTQTLEHMIDTFKFTSPLPDFHLDSCHRINDIKKSVSCNLLELRMLRKVLRSSIRKDLKVFNKDTYETEDKRRILFRVETCLLDLYRDKLNEEKRQRRIDEMNPPPEK